MCRFGVSESGLIIIVAFLLLKSRSDGHAASTDSTYAPLLAEHCDEASKESAHQRQVQARDLSDPLPPDSVHSYESQQSRPDADPSINANVYQKVHRLYTRSINSGFQNKNEEIQLEQNDKAHGTAGTGTASAESEDNEGFNPHAHDDDESFLAHDNHHLHSRQWEPNFEFVASASAFHEVVQVSPSDIRDSDSLSTDAERFGHDQTETHLSHSISRREALAAGVEVEESEQRPEKALVQHRSAKAVRLLSEANDVFLDLIKTNKIPGDNEGNLRGPRSCCKLGKDSGYNCPNLLHGKFMREYYYDPANNRCSHFMFKGCGGNSNRFPSMKACSESCVDLKLNNEAIPHGIATI
ncbi:unnamed protein product [Orchesella dallaii]|uniref:BPTI/Kunitz inhibitor domain-containing protein n=1 Tax=Orchesella dallaii TaxID=48710 RepID=A0ABP1RDX9_9HEXA